MVSSELSKHIVLPEPQLCFHPERVSDVDIHPLRGLLKYGPFTSGLLPDPIRVATLAPYREQKRLYGFLRDLRNARKPKERYDYLPDWPGFQRVFNVHMTAAEAQCHITFEQSIEEKIQESSTPHLVIAEQLARKIQLLDVHRSEYDVLFIYLPERWSTGFVGPIGDDFDLHDYIKSMSASKGMPVQIVREDKAPQYTDRASVMWRIGIALYTKAGGIPWKIAHSDPGTAHIGLSYAVRSSNEENNFVTCCSQVFDSDGSGLEFVAYDVDEVRIQRRNPFLSQTEMFRVMNRSIDLYRRRHAGCSPRSVVVHKTTEFKKEEVNGCLEAFHLCDSVDLIQIVQDVGWRGVRIDKPNQGNKGNPAFFPVMRGSLLNISPKEALLWTHGNVDNISKKGSYFQGSRSTPRPIKLVRYAGHGSWEGTATSILGLTKMNWNNDALYDVLPVTLGYASVLARVLKRIEVLKSTPYQVRFFM